MVFSIVIVFLIASGVFSYSRARHQPIICTISVDGLHPDLLPHLIRNDEWCRQDLGYKLIITSCMDGQCSITSRHYIGTTTDVWTSITPKYGQHIIGDARSDLIKQLK
jgi:hypothetical protein